ALFPGFSADRYGSVITALLALRKEKLSQHLDLAKLSETLSESLPPIDDHDIAAVAEGFERLDRRKAELAALEAEAAEVRLLAARQRDYARAVVVGAAGDVRAAETHRDDVTRAERLAKAALDEVEAESVAAATERRVLGQRIVAIGVEIDALKDSDAYRDGAALADLRAHAQRLRQAADRAARSAEEQEASRQAASVEVDDATGEHETAVANLALAASDLRAKATDVAAEGVVGEAATIEVPDDAERFVNAWVEAQRGRVREVRAALDDHTKAVETRGFLEAQLAEDDATVAERIAGGRFAREQEKAAAAAYQAAVDEWSAGCETIGRARVAAALPPPTAADPARVAEALGVLGAELGAENAVARRDLAAERATASADRQALIEERALWAEGGLVDPEGPEWRSSREGRPGAPLWRLVDVAPGVGPTEVDGLEAALTGAGLLDAWVEPDGAVDLGDGRADVVLGQRPATGRTLADVLVPITSAGMVVAGGPGGQEGVVADDSAFPADVLAAGTAVAGSAGGQEGVEVGESEIPDHVLAGVLASLPVAATAREVLDGAEVVVASDGTYRVGAAVGRGPRRPALLLGAVARERHRLARLASIDAFLAAVEATMADLDRREAALDRRRTALAAELAAVPSGAAVDDARLAVADAASRLGEAEARLDRTRAALTGTEGAVREALRALTALAARHSLPTEAGGLAAVEAGLTRFAQATATWARRRRDLSAAERDLNRAAGRMADAERAASRSAADHRDADRDATAVEGRVAGLESSLGAEYADLMRRLDALDRERNQAQRRERELAEQVPALERRVGALTGELAAAAAERASAEEKRAGAHQRFAAVAVALGPDAGIEQSGPLDTASALLAAARAIAAGHEAAEADPQVTERLSERVRERVHLAQAALGARVDVARELADEGWWVLRTVVGGVRRGATALASALAAELAEGRAELVAEEEKLFEQTLAGSVRRALAERIRQANALVDAINAQLATVRTMAGGVQVRLRWEVDPDQPDAVKAARALLLRDAADLSDEERAALQAFVRARVDQARAELEVNAPWEARLRQTLDYRSWHRFSLHLAHRDWEGFQPATARRLQKLSTGERSIALHLPMIASVAAHYAGDDGEPASCPRLILLDELFAGVDSANRAQLFGTFSAWDLDAVFTSDHEWCQYATLDGIAIHHLHPPTGDEPVTSTRFTWDGRRRRTDPPAA
ncbi:MAG TPA: SbcC/MukB-like Walker B domain-containing protein, partial [Acidimicrobiales bacterium]|nr:SbcC/MukB-like Walker B domain-containing protein [Acidimicrobiales bacterium]